MSPKKVSKKKYITKHRLFGAELNLLLSANNDIGQRLFLADKLDQASLLPLMEKIGCNHNEGLPLITLQLQRLAFEDLESEEPVKLYEGVDKNICLINAPYPGVTLIDSFHFRRQQDSRLRKHLKLTAYTIGEQRVLLQFYTHLKCILLEIQVWLLQRQVFPQILAPLELCIDLASQVIGKVKEQASCNTKNQWKAEGEQA